MNYDFILEKNLKFSVFLKVHNTSILKINYIFIKSIFDYANITKIYYYLMLPLRDSVVSKILCYLKQACIL